MDGTIDFALRYLLWHYTTGVRDLVTVFGNFFWGIRRVFGLKDIFRTFFAPWKRLQEEQVNVFADTAGFFTNLVINILMRFVGVFARVALLVTALVLFAILGGVFLLSFLLWLVLPPLVPAVAIIGVLVILSAPF